MSIHTPRDDRRGPRATLPAVTEEEQLRQKVKQEALAAWRSVEPFAYVFGQRRDEYCLTWLQSIYGETFGLESEL